jgi:hypothetical protein
MALLRLRQRLKRRGKTKAWRKLGYKASAYRKRMIESNRGRKSQRKRYNKASHVADTRVRQVRMSPETARLYARVMRLKGGQKAGKLFTKFWKLSHPPSIDIVPGDGKKKIIPLMVIGPTKKVFLSNGNKGEQGKKMREISGNWIGATESSGRHVVLLTNRPFQGKLKFVGHYAPRTDYVPPPDIEKAGSPKSGFHWKHIHGAKDGKNIPLGELEWPKVYADRNGKVDGNSNFVYGTTKHGKITDWMYH